jgi:acyl-[acyl-carrier-protein]-phospholipid O-acyltransferase/long-chain-fatty-acid--[acyl-carrier-protein] ligase
MATMAAIIAGTWAGGILYDTTSVVEEETYGTHRWWISAIALLSVALTGWAASLFIGRLRPADPARRCPREPVSQIVHDLRLLVSHRGLFLVSLASAFFWGLGALAQVNVDQFAQFELCVDQTNVGPLLGTLVLGIGVGNVLAGILSAGRIELGIVPFGAAGLVVTSLLVAVAPGSSADDPSRAAYIWTCVCLFAMGVSAGMYDVPLQSYLQSRSPPENRGSVMAAYNILAFSVMLLAAPFFWFLRDACGLSARTVFVVAGLGTLPVLVCIVLLITRDTLRFILRTTMRILYRVRIEGLENLPAEGGYLVAPNHVSWIDGFLIVLSLPKRVRFIVFADYFSGRFSRWFGELAELIPIQPGKRTMIESLRTAREALQSGDAVGIFPEGQITRSGQMQEFKPGFLKVLKGTGAPVIPVYLGGLWGSVFSNSGGRFFWKLPRRWPYPVLIRIGRPIYNPSGVEEVREAVVKLGEG